MEQQRGPCSWSTVGGEGSVGLEAGGTDHKSQVTGHRSQTGLRGQTCGFDPMPLP